MTESIKLVNNIRSLRAQVRNIPLEILDDVLDKFRVIIDERREEDAYKSVEIQARKDKIAELCKLMERDGINPEEIFGTLSKNSLSKRKRKPRPPKYKFTDENGDVKTWTGQGRTPKILSKLMASGKSLEDYLL